MPFCMIEFETLAQTREETGERSATGDFPNGVKNPAINSESRSESRLQLFEELILPHLDSAHNLARWLMGRGDDAQDVVQEAYLRAFRFFDGYNGGDAKAWLMEIVRNTCFTRHRREKRNLTTVVFDEAAHTSSGGRPNAEEMLVQASNRSILQNCIERLPATFREVIVMRELEEMSYLQIAQATRLPVGTVMSRLSRARKRLGDCAKGRDTGAGE
jgi:RNA polymerase sigma-70 factor, ECF subfamily